MAPTWAWVPLEPGLPSTTSHTAVHTDRLFFVAPLPEAVASATLTSRRDSCCTCKAAHDLTPSSELLHGDKEVVYGDAGYQGFAKRPEMAGTAAEFRVAMLPGKHRGLPDTPKGRLQDLIETALAAGFCLQ